uniref:Uncharacterized protein LOC112835582 n=1 Tax=Callorhinus ursinus TaxID=34884 RepID=A0A3Q7RQG2_CALUR|nr:uncharacterized protein LOC112835582 [Callorhinus ursinus]
MANKKPGDGKVNTNGRGETTFTDKDNRSPVPKWTKDMNKQCPKIRSRQTCIWEGVRIPKQLTKYQLQQQCNLTSRCDGNVGQATGAGHRPAGTVLKKQAAAAEDIQAHGGPALCPCTRGCVHHQQRGDWSLKVTGWTAQGVPMPQGAVERKPRAQDTSKAGGTAQRTPTKQESPSWKGCRCQHFSIKTQQVMN